jgi:hypothetical protein
MNDNTLDRRSLESIREIVREAVAEFGPQVIAETLTHFGFDMSNPLAVQRQQEYLRRAVDREADPEVQKQRAWTAETYARCNKFYDGATSAVMKGAGAVVFGLLSLGVIAWIKDQGK